MFLIRFVIWSTCVVTLLTGGSASAGVAAPDPAAVGDEQERAATARSLYELGMGRFQLEEYDAAIAYWEEGFRNKPAPELLYNIGQAHRLAHRPDKALAFYQKYLRMSPNAANRAEVERTIAALAREPRATAPAANMSADSRSRDVVNWRPDSPPPRPLVKRAWFWGVVGAGAAVVAAAVVVGVVVGGQRHDPAQSLPPINFAARF
jgi:tetratricopeptide (TPR) repeat protein